MPTRLSWPGKVFNAVLCILHYIYPRYYLILYNILFNLTCNIITSNSLTYIRMYMCVYIYIYLRTSYIRIMYFITIWFYPCIWVIQAVSRNKYKGKNLRFIRPFDQMHQTWMHSRIWRMVFMAWRASVRRHAKNKKKKFHTRFVLVVMEFRNIVGTKWIYSLVYHIIVDPVLEEDTESHYGVSSDLYRFHATSSDIVILSVSLFFGRAQASLDYKK